MTEKVKNLTLVLLLTAVVLALGLWLWFGPDAAYSDAERRLLEQRPELSADAVLDGNFMEKTESFAQDQFPLRDSFRTLKALAAYKLFGQLDNNGLYLAEGHVSKQEYPLSEEQLTLAADKFRAIYDRYLTGMRVYFSIVPDKNYYLAAKNGRLSLDYDRLYSLMHEQTDFMTPVDIRDILSQEDYYYTDSHWRQERLGPVAQRLAGSMGTKLTLPDEERTLPTPFYGVYCGQSALPLAPDKIRYLTDDTLEACTVTSYRTGNPAAGVVYDFERGAGRDGYDFFLSGADPVVVIENPNAESDRELVMFRDSFGSSLAPLLVSGYKKVTLIDIRYVRSELLGAFVKFENQDVLFLYSTTMLNQSAALR